jgi:hypothetical protein
LKDSSWKVLDLSSKEAPSFFRSAYEVEVEVTFVYCINIQGIDISSVCRIYIYTRKLAMYV